ncbi:hypothetical protein [Salipiger mucosus]|uniref:Uncharacterized protein n=1 Tax=Salipiger mucosus DSM 16094 TaxID=1123237 RepID=S9RW04_9RHOB|nr:hypothetical protein [Salipiger mucosus]EPX82190.1 hypothetical protein Salmuc_05447 [Salipiger mucosus DSM 16094]
MAFADHPTLHPANWLRDLQAQVPRKLARDYWNRLRFGPEAPQSDECVYVDPGRTHFSYDPKAARRKLRRSHSGMVLGGDWDRCRRPLDSHVKIASVRERYLGGVPWEQTALFDKLLREIRDGHHPDGLESRKELVQRYEVLDRVFEETRRRGRLLTRAELPEFFRREHGGILVHIDREGAPMRAGGGMHRFAIAKVLELPEIPAQLGVVHPQALRAGLLAPLRQSLAARTAA